MIKFRCTNKNCSNPVLFEGDFIGVVVKKCPKCKRMIEFKRSEYNNLEKTC